MRAGWVTAFLLFATAAGCGASPGSRTDAGPGGNGGGSGGVASGGNGGTASGGSGGDVSYDAYPNGTFCDMPLGDDCSPKPLLSSTAPICSLDEGISFACNPCGVDGGQNCGIHGALVRGSQYTYIEILNVDVVFVYAYDLNNKLVAKLEWSANGAFAGQAWTCSAGPAVFDSREAMALLPSNTSANELLCAR
ncbi:MAG TPA: hypothetical protein VN903_06945 [Polyangia bacterium]|jgi:hypothetical protein|nr:hypothetical protein [Polyangia bacterium]